MGVLWTVWPIDNQMREWLASQGVESPDEASRFPTGMEIKDVLNTLRGYRIDIQENDLGKIWQARIESEEDADKNWTLLNINEYTGDSNTQELWFEKGNEKLIKLILEKLSAVCGPLGLMADDGGVPEIIRSKRKAHSKKKYAPSMNQLLSLKAAGNPKISPDGQMVAYTVQEPDWALDRFTTQIHLVDINTRKRIQLTQREKGAFNPKWSPNGKWLAFLSERENGNSNIHKKNKKSGQPEVAKIQIWLISPFGGEGHLLTKSETDIIDFQWSPDSSQIAFHAPAPVSKDLIERKEEYGEFDILDEDITMNALWIITVASKRLIQAFMSTEQSVENYDWSPINPQIALELASDPRPGGRKTNTLFLLNLDDRSVKSLVGQKGPNTHPKWSPDGTMIAYETAMGREDFYFANWRIAVISADGGSPISFTDTFDESPKLLCWGPKGIYFLASQQMNVHLFCVDPDNKNIARISSPEKWIGSDFNFSEDFNTVTFLSGSAQRLIEVFISPMDRFNPQQVTRFNNQVTRFAFGFRETLRWKSSDETEIEGVLYKPYNFNPKRKYPLLVIIHGGPPATSRPLLDPLQGVYPIELWLAKGALILSPNYRGSAGYGEAFRSLNVRNLGVGDIWDIHSGIDHLISLGIVDEERMGAMGWSQGGYISAFLTTHSKRFKAISVGAGISNWMTYYVNTDIPPFTRQYLKATPWNDPEIYAKTSPMTTIRNASTPTLIQHGEKDQRVPIANSYELHQGLKDQNVPVKMIVYKGFGHHINNPKSLKAALTHNLEWFNQWIWGASNK